MSCAHRLAGLLLAAWLSWGCESRDPWEGSYAVRIEEDPGGPVRLVLQAGGRGQWMVGQENIPLRWEERGGSLWLHLRSGGILVAHPVPGQSSLNLDLPGAAALTLRRQP